MIQSGDRVLNFLKPERTACLLKLARMNENNSFNEAGKIAVGCSRRYPCDGHAVPGTQTNFESFNAFFEDVQMSLLLECVDRTVQTVQQLGFQGDGLTLRDAAPLGFKRDSGEPNEPFCQVDSPIGPFQSVIVASLMSKNRVRQDEKDGLT